MKHKKNLLSLMAVIMLSALGFSAAKIMNQNDLSDQVLANIEAISADESTTVCCEPIVTTDVCYTITVVDSQGRVLSTTQVKGLKC